MHRVLMRIEVLTEAHSKYCNLGHEMGRNLLKMDQISLCNGCHFLSRIQGLNNTLDRIN